MSKISLLSENSSRPAAMDDLKAVATLYNACSTEQVGRALWDETEIRSDWKVPDFDFDTDTRVVLAPNGELAGYASIWDRAPHVRSFADVYVHPAHTGRSIGTFLEQWADERACHTISQAPEGVRVVLQQRAFSSNVAAQALLRQRGYRLVRHFLSMAIEMDAPPPEPVVREGITIRHLRRDREARALVCARRDAFKDHWGHVEQPFEEEYAQWVTWMDDDPAFDESLWFVAMDGEEIAGFSLCYDITGEGPDVGTVASLGIRRPWRRQGIALALLGHSFAEMYRRGRTTVTLGVDASSLTGATRLYEKVGMRVRHQSDRFEKELRPGKDPSTRSIQE
ncbi:MAG: GNAT family N-acetyltransferase [Chloroflexi bacterium]|nr:GNAT family N-acetyltransferase [Chloroflexota bacterium]